MVHRSGIPEQTQLGGDQQMTRISSKGLALIANCASLGDQSWAARDPHLTQLVCWLWLALLLAGVSCFHTIIPAFLDHWTPRFKQHARIDQSLSRCGSIIRRRSHHRFDIAEDRIVTEDTAVEHVPGYNHPDEFPFGQTQHNVK